MNIHMCALSSVNPYLVKQQKYQILAHDTYYNTFFTLFSLYWKSMLSNFHTKGGLIAT